MKKQNPQSDMRKRSALSRRPKNSLFETVQRHAPVAFGGALLIAVFAFVGNYMGRNAIAHNDSQLEVQASLGGPTTNILTKGSLLPVDNNFDIVVNPNPHQGPVLSAGKGDSINSGLTEELVVAGGKQDLALEKVAVAKVIKDKRVIISPAAIDLTVDNSKISVKPVTKRMALAALAAKNAPPKQTSSGLVLTSRRSVRPDNSVDTAPTGTQLAEENCLARAVYFESRSESEQGQLAVAKVILNRTKTPGYPKTICGVVYQGSSSRNSCQFSFSCDGMPDDVRQPGAWAHSKMIARKAMSGNGGMEVISTATNYHADYVKPRWASSMKRLVKIGRHIFYSGG